MREHTVTEDERRDGSPAGWRRVRLGALCDIVAQQVDPKIPEYGALPHVNGENIESGTGRMYNVKSAASDGMTSGKYLFEAGDVLYSKLRPYLRKVALAPTRGVCSADMYPIRCDPEKLVPEFAVWLLLSDAFTSYADAESRRARMPKINRDQLFAWEASLPPPIEQRRILALLQDKMAAIEKAKKAAEAQVEGLQDLLEAALRASMGDGEGTTARLSDCLVEVTAGVGDTWKDHKVLGATREGLANAKEGVGKQPQRYKPVAPGTIFYNPMRILIGSIAMVDIDDEPGITSPDYVVLRGKPGVLHHRYFYYWLRSRAGAAFIKTLARGAVRERKLFQRLASGIVEIPSWKAQERFAAKALEIRTAQQKLAEQLSAINALPAALLRQAFRGEL